MSDNQGFPSMTALLGLLALAGYQNKDKIAEWFGQATQANPANQPARTGAPAGDIPKGADSVLGNLGTLGAGGIGGFLNGGLGELLDRFKQAGQGEKADSWVRQGPNQDVAPPDLEQAIGPDILAKLERQTGLSRDELLSRLSRQLPDAVDRYTPDGRLPAAGA
ncbi:YidB family protein [Bosea sp. 2KB_26]|uniref:YidB family protein n=1 Tax=Bosea sp. 2KB_26 TaxID=3237475 RepID=UPI003F8E8101